MLQAFLATGKELKVYDYNMDRDGNTVEGWVDVEKTDAPQGSTLVLREELGEDRKINVLVTSSYLWTNYDIEKTRIYFSGVLPKFKDASPKSPLTVKLPTGRQLEVYEQDYTLEKVAGGTKIKGWVVLGVEDSYWTTLLLLCKDILSGTSSVAVKTTYRDSTSCYPVVQSENRRVVRFEGIIPTHTIGTAKEKCPQPTESKACTAPAKDVKKLVVTRDGVEVDAKLKSWGTEPSNSPNHVLYHGAFYTRQELVTHDNILVSLPDRIPLKAKVSSTLTEGDDTLVCWKSEPVYKIPPIATLASPASPDMVKKSYSWLDEFPGASTPCTLQAPSRGQSTFTGSGSFKGQRVQVVKLPLHVFSSLMKQDCKVSISGLPSDYKIESVTTVLDGTYGNVVWVYVSSATFPVVESEVYMRGICINCVPFRA